MHGSSFVSNLFCSLCIVNTHTVQTIQYKELNVFNISVSSFIQGSHDAKERILQQFDNAFYNYGIVKLVDHGIPSTLSGNIFDTAYEFFNQTTEVKMKHNFGRIGVHGYQPVGVQNANGYSDYNDTDNLNTFDALESFNIYSNYKNMIEMQQGIVTIPSFISMPRSFTGSSIIQAYWSSIRKLLRNIHSIASQALGFEEKNNVFEKNMSTGHMHIRLAHYIAIGNVDVNNVVTDEFEKHETFVRFGAHRDYSGFTMIHSEYADELQVYYNDTWYSIPPYKNSILLLGGEFISMWTNNYWKSALHRVMSKSIIIKPRKSIITFSSPDMDTIIDILPCYKCIQNNQIRMFQPVNGIEWVNSRVQKTATTTSTITNSKYPWEKDVLML